jgi:hypothetical protein
MPRLHPAAPTNRGNWGLGTRRFTTNPSNRKAWPKGKLIVTYLNQNIAAKLMESVLAAFRSETADLERLAEEVDAAGQEVGKIRTAIEQYAKRRTQAMETIHSMLQADAAEFREALAKR